MEIDYEKIESKEALILLVKKLSTEDPEKWENTSTSNFLEALSAWLESADSFYKNFNLETSSEKPSWQLFADAL